MSESEKGISIVIPARNEQDNIVVTINSILKLKLDEPIEIIVVDHLSVDDTANRARNAGAKVLGFSGPTIGSARNFGAAHARYDIIVFIDADVSLTTLWGEEINSVLVRMRKAPNYLTGSHCLAPEDGSFIEKYWFNSFSADKKTTHLGTGHLIVSKSFFESITGFSEVLITGEDYDFCIRAKENGGVLENTASLVVVHRDFPKTLISFVQRERWHGKGDCQNFSDIFKSKVALMSLCFLILHVAIGVTAIFNIWPVTILCLVFLILLLVVSSIYKFQKSGMQIVLINSAIFYAYYLGRSLSLMLRSHKK